MDLGEMGCGGKDWIDLAQDRDQRWGFCEHSTKPLGCMKCWEFFELLLQLVNIHNTSQYI
jgi:hypothetical protein